MLEALAGNLTWLKFPLALATAVLSVAVLYGVRNRPTEAAFLRNAVIGITLLKLVGCVLVYAFAPIHGLGSDAQHHYLPQALRVLSGEIPHRDFTTSYGPLFPFLIAPGLLLWRSAGSIVFTMLLVEAAMIAVYVLRCRRAGFSGHWRVSFLYVCSPISWYWVGAVGTNSVVIACFAMLSLALADARRDVAAGIAAALGLAFSKITMILAWPAVVLFRRPGILSRGMPIAVVLVVLAALSRFEVDVAERAVNFSFRATSGNIWFLLSMLGDFDLQSKVVKQLSMLSLLLALTPVCLLFLVGRARDGRGGFDSSTALLSAVNLIFMILSYKTYPWYLAASLLFILHTLLADDEPSLRPLIPLMFLGSITHLEPRFWMLIRDNPPGLYASTAASLFVLDVVMLAAFLYWTVLCLRRARL
jgi:hypothetical protein